MAGSEPVQYAAIVPDVSTQPSAATCSQTPTSSSSSPPPPPSSSPTPVPTDIGFTVPFGLPVLIAICVGGLVLILMVLLLIILMAVSAHVTPTSNQTLSMHSHCVLLGLSVVAGGSAGSSPATSMCSKTIHTRTQQWSWVI